MRSLRDRLDAMQTTTTAPDRTVQTGVPIEHVAPGIERVNSSGKHFLIEKRVTDPTDGALASRQHLLPGALRSRLDDLRLDPEGIIFLDTETTGLDRGAGTHVFLVGVGYFEGDTFKTRQYFLRELYEERSLLHDLSELLHRFPVLVTFNGRSFDWPLLYNRFILHGYRNLPEFIHWDLLPASRRVWRFRLRDCSLGSLERNLLGVQRIGDVPGYLIPQIYFDYLRTKDARPLAPVFSHNHEDVVSLARLADLILETESDPDRTLTHGEDRLAWGLYLLANGRLDQAVSLMRGHLGNPLIDSELRGRAFRELGICFRRRGRWHDAVAVWEAMLEQSWKDPGLAIHPLIELAKFHEHRTHHYSRARTYTERALNMVEIRGLEQFRAELIHRAARLEAKVRRMYSQRTESRVRMEGS